MQNIGTVKRTLIQSDMRPSAVIREISCRSCGVVLMIVPGNLKDAYRVRCGNCGTSHTYQTFPVGFQATEDEDEDQDEDLDEDEDAPETVPIWCRFRRKIRRRSIKRKERT